MEGGLVSFDPEHLLELHGAHARSQSCREKCSQEPCVERLLAPMHDRPRSEARIPLAVVASVDSRPTSEGKGWTSVPFVLLTVVADKAIGKALSEEVGDACFLVREALLEFRQRLRDTTAPLAFRHR